LPRAPSRIQRLFRWRYAGVIRSDASLAVTGIARGRRIGAPWALRLDPFRGVVVTIARRNDFFGRDAVFDPMRKSRDDVMSGIAADRRRAEYAANRARARSASAMIHARSHEQAIEVRNAIRAAHFIRDLSVPEYRTGG
jgi:hypothetical protein